MVTTTFHETKTRYPGIRSRHRLDCPVIQGRRCSCPTRFVAKVYDPHRRGGKGGYASKTFFDLAEARAWKAKLEGRKEAGESVSPKSSTTVQQVVDEFLERAESGRLLNAYGKPYAKRSVEVMRSSAKNAITPSFGHRPVASVRAGEIQTWVEDMDYAPNTVRSIFGQMSLLLTYAARREMREPLSLRDVQLPAQPETSRRAPSHEMALRLISALPERDRPIWQVAHYTGARNIELVTLRLEDIDLKAGLLRLGETVAKTPAAKRSVPILDVLRPVLARLIMQAEPGATLAFPPRRGAARRNQSSIIDAARTVWDKAELPTFTLHEFRHGFKGALVRAGVDSLVRDVLMGHGLGRMDRTYVHLTDDDLLAAGRKLELHFNPTSSTKQNQETADGQT